ncbi:MAG: TVP38/TMEM64 family protein [Nitrospirae bacterium]|nr:MAG: TVP38/TMEM64 family protein [Nitrospirota bacterium]
MMGGPMPTHIQEIPARSTRWPVGKIVIAALFLLVIAAFFYFDLKHYLSLESLKDNRAKLLFYTEMHYVQAVAAFLAIYCLQTAFSLPGGALLTLAGGFLFGSILGTIYVNIAATTGATLAFLASRYLLRDWVERKFGHRLGPIQEGFRRNAFSYLLTLRLIPAFPFFLVNLVSGLTRINIGTYVLATAVGIIPGSFVFANAGRQLGSINSLAEIASPAVLGAFALLGLFALAPVLYRRFVRRAGHP